MNWDGIVERGGYQSPHQATVSTQPGVAYGHGTNTVLNPEATQGANITAWTTV